MEKPELGKSYDAGDLAKLCGEEEDIRYGYYAFVGDRATVIAQDEGNDIVKVTEIIRNRPECPKCEAPIDSIYTSRTVQLVYSSDKWSEEQADRYNNYGCPECGEELSVEDLDELGVPEEGR